LAEKGGKRGSTKKRGCRSIIDKGHHAGESGDALSESNDTNSDRDRGGFRQEKAGLGREWKENYQNNRSKAVT